MNYKRLYNQLKTLREEQPVLWAVIRGASSVGAIAKSLMWTPQEVIADLESTEAVTEANGSPGVWVLSLDVDKEEADHYRELQEFSKKLFNQVVKWERDNRPLGVQGLTGKQARLAALLQREFTDQPFTTLQAAQAQGYDKAGFTANLLGSLERKGILESIPGRPKLWVSLDVQLRGEE